MTMFERILFASGIAITLLATAGLCAQVYVWRTVCAPAVTDRPNELPRGC